MFLVIILYLCLASGFTFGKAALTYMQPWLFIGIRMIIGGALLLCYQVFFKRERLAFHRQHLSLFAGMCLFHIYGAYVLEYWALQYISSFKACLLYNLSPFFTAFFAGIWAHEVMTSRKWIGLIVGFVGMLPILIESDPGEQVSGMIGFLSYAELVLIGSVVCASIGWLLMRKLVHSEGYSPIIVNGISMVIGGIMALVSSLIFEGWPHLLVQTESSDTFFKSNLVAAIFYIGLLILLSNIISYNLYGVLLRSYSATFLSFAGFMAPLFAALLSNIFFGEVPSIWFFVSAFLVGLGLYIFYREELLQAELST